MQNYLSEFNCKSSIGLKWRNWLLNRQNRQYNFVVKMVQGESRAKEKPKEFHFAQPSRSLCYAKMVQGESRAKEKPKVFHFALPSRSLSSAKMVQGESRAKESKCFYCGCLYFGLPRHRVLDECYIAIKMPRTGAKAKVA